MTYSIFVPYSLKIDDETALKMYYKCVWRRAKLETMIKL